MAKFSAKGVLYVLVPMLMIQLSSLVGAVDIIFYEDTTKCSGSGYSFNSIGNNICCEVSAQDGGSVLVTSTTGSSQASLVFRGGGCSTQAGSGSGNVCYVGGGFTGAEWYNARRRSLLSTSCDASSKPSGVVFSEDGSKGHWILATSEAEEMYEQMQKILDAEKASWLQSLGATYRHL